MPGSKMLDIVMELCDGTIIDFCENNSRFPKFNVKGIMRDTAEGLQYLHNESIIHKDIKPGNVLLSNKSGRAKLADFGISKQVPEGQTSV